eukprot:scaffold8760_cov116-Isochrysis_galbana.AAC.14
MSQKVHLAVSAVHSGATCPPFVGAGAANGTSLGPARSSSAPLARIPCSREPCDRAQRCRGPSSHGAWRQEAVLNDVILFLSHEEDI